MRTILKILFLIFIFSCKNQPNNKIVLLSEIKNEHSEKQSYESIFDLIINKKESPKNFPDSIAYKFDFSKRFTGKEISVLNLDTTKIDLNEYYFLTNQIFLEKTIDSLSFLIYFKHQYGDQLEKILRVKKQNSNFDLVLAMEGGDSFSHSISTEFINDSTFISTYTHKDGDIIYSKNNGQESTYEYYYDSIISKYKYDNSLNLKLLQIDTLKFSKQIFYRNNKILGSYYLKAYSKPFSFQEKECVWEYMIPNYATSNGISYTQNLLDNISKKVLLKGQNDVDNYTETINNLFGVHNLNAGTKDINFDSFDDIYFHNRVKSGTAGEFTDVYLFNKTTGIYEYSNLFSGYNLIINKADKTISYSSRGGGGIYFLRDIYFDNKSKFSYEKKFSSDYIKIDDEYKKVYTYEKIIKNIVIEKVKDTINNPELEFWEWKKKYE